MREKEIREQKMEIETNEGINRRKKKKRGLRMGLGQNKLKFESRFNKRISCFNLLHETNIFSILTVIDLELTTM